VLAPVPERIPVLRIQSNATDAQRTKARAEALFKKENQRREGEKAMAEYQARSEAVLAKTARLRALRLARDAATQKAASQPPAEKRAG
jgi:hypothetical protein